jgi:hypothetical protein
MIYDIEFDIDSFIDEIEETQRTRRQRQQRMDRSALIDANSSERTARDND